MKRNSQRNLTSNLNQKLVIHGKIYEILESGRIWEAAMAEKRAPSGSLILPQGPFHSTKRLTVWICRAGTPPIDRGPVP